MDLSDLERVSQAFRPNTRMLWIESPTNPMLKIFDIEALAKLARLKNALSVVDNTFMSSYFQKPLDLGADVVIHSVTKYMNGHSDVVGGVFITNQTKLYDEMKYLQNAVGAVPGPQDCFLVMRGLKTLHLRMREHEKNAKMIAEFLQKHPRVTHVIYPGLPSHPQHVLAKKQMSGFGGMISFTIKGQLEDAKRILERVKVFTLAESLGGVESLIEHPSLMTHASIPPETRKALGIEDTLIRISAGVEDGQDLIDDLSQAMA
jgi:cystathionine gamma-lyase